MTYQLKFDAFSGDWDGKDVDVVEVRAGTQEQSFAIGPEHSVNRKNPNVAKRVTMQFRASEAVTSLSFYAGFGQLYRCRQCHCDTDWKAQAVGLG